VADAAVMKNGEETEGKIRTTKYVIMEERIRGEEELKEDELWMYKK
jgi:hypothetical protein